MACGPEAACVARRCVATGVDAGADAGSLAGTLWLFGNFVDPMGFAAARVSERLGVSERFVLSTPDGGLAELGYATVSEDGEWLMAIMTWEDPARMDLFVLRPDGSDLRRLVTGDDDGFLAGGGVSPASVIWFDGKGDVRVTPLDGGATVSALPSHWVHAGAGWLWVAESRDGRYVSVVAEHEATGGSRQLWLTDTWSSTPTPVELISAAEAGGSLAHSRGPIGYGQFTAGDRVVLKGQFDATSTLGFSAPDGGAADRLVSLALDGSDLRLVDGTATGPEQVGTYGVSPDGSTIAFSRVDAAGNAELYVVPADASAAARRISAGGHLGGPWQGEPLVFSPDGRAVAFAASWEHGRIFDPWVVWVDGEFEGRRFTMPGSSAVQGRVLWSPDSRHLGFVSNHLGAGHQEVFVAEARGAVGSPRRPYPIEPSIRCSVEAHWTPR